jgi:5'-3' exonuclease
VIESFRNDLWPGYKTGAGVDPSLLAQFPLLERAIEALGVRVWAMVEQEADDAMAAAAEAAAADGRVEQVLICTPDKDLAQCVVDGRVVQLDRRSGRVFDEGGVREKFGVGPASIPDWLALVGDSADGSPGMQAPGTWPSAGPPSSPRRWSPSAISRCCSAAWRRCAPMPTSGRWTNGAGEGPRPGWTSGPSGSRPPGS